MKVQDIIERKGRKVVTIAPDATLVDASRLLADHQIGAVIVVRGDSVAGILSERDIVRHFAEHQAAEAHRKVEDEMSRDVITCTSGDDVEDVMERMTRHRTRHLPVVDDGQLAGLISIGDVVKHRLTEIETEKNVLRDILVSR